VSITIVAFWPLYSFCSPFFSPPFFYFFLSSFGLAFNLKANANDIHCLLGGVWGHTFSKTIAMVITQP
jgi:xylose isomerase